MKAMLAAAQPARKAMAMPSPVQAVGVVVRA